MGGRIGGYYRVERDDADRVGGRQGMLGLLRDLRQGGSLDVDDEAEASALVARAYALHPEPPASAYPTGALSWFLAEAGAAGDGLRALTAEIVEFLDRHGVATRSVWTDDPGVVTYADAVQIVAVPRADQTP